MGASLKEKMFEQNVDLRKLALQIENTAKRKVVARKIVEQTVSLRCRPGIQPEC
jgi:hypothetical protein